MTFPPRIQQLIDDVQKVLAERGVIGGRVLCVRNKRREIVVALVAPADFAATSVRDQDHEHKPVR
jgi:hypothetical protein